MSESDSSGTYSALIGFKFAVAEKTDLVIGYEITKYWSDVDPYHFITVGFSWSFLTFGGELTGLLPFGEGGDSLICMT